MPEHALLDTGVLVAFLHRDDQAHTPSAEALKSYRGVLFSTEAVLTESAYLLGRVPGGAEACLEFFYSGRRDPGAVHAGIAGAR